MKKSFYSWKTTKKEKGYQYTINRVTPLNKPTKKGYYAKTTKIKTGVLPSRAKAKAQAQRYIRYYKFKNKVRKPKR